MAFETGRDFKTSTARGRAGALVAMGLAGMAVGVLVYLTDRGAADALLIPAAAAAAAATTGGPLFGAIGLWLPSAIHPFSFSLFSAALLAPRPCWSIGACGFWFVVNAAFEIGQHPQCRAPLAAALRRGFGDGPVARACQNYFLRGTFDSGDLAAAALGALLAAWVLHHHRIQPEQRHAP